MAPSLLHVLFPANCSLAQSLFSFILWKSRVFSVVPLCLTITPRIILMVFNGPLGTDFVTFIQVVVHSYFQKIFSQLLNDGEDRRAFVTPISWQLIMYDLFWWATGIGDGVQQMIFVYLLIVVLIFLQFWHCQTEGVFPLHGLRPSWLKAVMELLMNWKLGEGLSFCSNYRGIFPHSAPSLGNQPLQETCCDHFLPNGSASLAPRHVPCCLGKELLCWWEDEGPEVQLLSESLPVY